MPAVAPTGVAAPATVAPEPVLLPLDPDVVSGVLDNGFTYYLERHKAEDKRAHLLLAVKAGSVLEDDDQRGLAHFVEHMAFNGTRRFEKQTLVDFFEKSGLKFGSHANASTQYDRTMYQLSVPTDEPALLVTGLNVLEDWAGGLSFDPDEVKKERPVLASEWTSSQGVGRRVGEQQRRLLLAGSKYAEREVIGDKAVLEHAPIERLVAFYRRWYRPDRMALIAVGDIDPLALRQSIETQFARLPVPAGERENPSIDIPVRQQPTVSLITDPESQAALVSVLYKGHAHQLLTETDYRQRLVAEMGVQMLSRRLATLAESPSAPFTAASSNLSAGLFGQLDVVQVSARAKAAKLKESLDALLDELERVKRHGFTPTELARTKEEYARSLERAVAAEATVDGLSRARALANHFVSGDALPAPELLSRLGTRLVTQISGAELQQAALAWMNTSERLVLASGASRDALPDEASLLAALSAADTRPVAAYVDDVVQRPLLSELPTPGSIVKEERVDAVGITVWTLSNGARVVLKPTTFKSDEILEQSVSYGGSSRAGDGDFPSIRFAAELVSVGGVGEFDRQTLNKILSGKVVSASPWVGEQDEGIRASAAPKDVETMFQLIYLYATSPRRDTAAFEAYRASLREGLRNRDLNPNAAFGDAIGKALWNNQLRRMPPPLASVEAIDLDVALAFYAQRFADVSDFTFVFVGVVDEPSFRPLVERYLASLPGGGRKDPFRDLGLHRKKGVTKVRVQQGKTDKAVATFLYHGESPWSENAHTDLDSLEAYLSIRLREVLREELGGVYTPHVTANFERVPFDAYSFAISFECKPADVDKLKTALSAVLADVKKSGVAASYLEKIAKQRTRNLEEAYRSNGFWLERLVNQYKMNEDPKQILILHELTKRVTSDNIRLAARKYLRDDQYLDALLTPGR